MCLEMLCLSVVFKVYKNALAGAFVSSALHLDRPIKNMSHTSQRILILLKSSFNIFVALGGVLGMPRVFFKNSAILYGEEHMPTFLASSDAQFCSIPQSLPTDRRTSTPSSVLPIRLVPQIHPFSSISSLDRTEPPNLTMPL